MEYKEYIGMKVCEARIEKKIKVVPLSDLCGLSRASLINIEAGRQLPPIPTLYKIAHTLGKPIGFFLPEMDPKGEVESIMEATPIPLRTLRELEAIPLPVLNELIIHYKRMKKAQIKPSQITTNF